MDASEMEALVQRLVDDPHDHEALAQAHGAGGADPKAYAVFLERVGQATADPGYASHWLTESANVWSTTLGDAHRAARVLMMAVDKDPTHEAAAERLAELYRTKGEHKALVALLERRAKALAPLIGESDALRLHLAGVHEELGRLWSEPPLQSSKKAIENYKRAIDLDATSAFAVYALRELYKQAGQWALALPLFVAEQALVTDVERKVALHRDEADVQRLAGQLAGVSASLRAAHRLTAEDPTLTQELGASILERVHAGHALLEPELREGAELFVTLAESYDGEHGLAYSLAALDLVPAHDRAMQLAAHYASQLGQADALVGRWRAYLTSNPDGVLAPDAPPAAAPISAGEPVAPPTQAGTPPVAATALEDDVEDLDEPDSSDMRPPPSSRVDERQHAELAEALEPSARAVPGPTGPPPPETSAAGDPPPVPLPAPASLGATPSDTGRNTALAGAPRAATTGRIPAPPPPTSTARSAPVEQARSAPAPSQPAAPLDPIQAALAAGKAFAAKKQRPQALAKYREVLSIDPAQPEALQWVEDHLRQKRLYAELRDVLMHAVRAPSSDPETRKGQLVEVASLCETQLRDTDTAVVAWKQICAMDPADEASREHLRRLLERTARWDELAGVLEDEAAAAPDPDARLAIEKRLAQLHEGKRKDPVAAGEVWSRIASRRPGDEAAIQSALKLFEKAQRRDLAVQLISERAGEIADAVARAALYVRVAEYHEQAGAPGDAGEAYVLAAEAQSVPATWEVAERALIAGKRWGRAAFVSERRAELARDPKTQASLFAQAAVLRERAEELPEALRCAERASDLDPASDALAAEVERHYAANGAYQAIAELYLRRAERLDQPRLRATLRERAGTVLHERLGDAHGARAAWLRALEDGDHPEVLRKLAADAQERGAAQEARDYLHRLVDIAESPDEKLSAAIAEADLLAGPLDDVSAAIARYLWVADTFSHRPALDRAITLEDARGNHAGLAGALERALPSAASETERVENARKLAELYEGELHDPKNAIRVLEIVRAADPEDFEAIARLLVLSETVQDWPRVAEMLQALAEIEGDEQELSVLTRRLASVLADRLDRPSDALAALAVQAAAGDEPSREAYIELADAVGRRGDVATKLVAWYGQSAPSPKRNQALRSAFDRFVAERRDEPAAKVGVQLARSKGGDHDLAQELERIAARLGDLDALRAAHDFLARELPPEARALEVVRQAEVLAKVGVPPVQAQQHGELGLAHLAYEDVEPLLARLAKLTEAPGLVIDLYERQVGRCKVPAERTAALGRAAQVAVARGNAARAKTFYALALAASSSDETLQILEQSAAEGDREMGGKLLRQTLAEALSGGGQGARDGGRSRSMLLRRAAELAHRSLGDVDRAFAWLGDALIVHVDGALLDALEQLAREVGDIRRAESTISRALAEVFDGPYVRQLLARRIRLRRDVLGDRAGAAEDLKRLHEVAPGDVAVMDELSALLTELGDSLGMVHVLEDQILRGKDPHARAELARKVARLWQRELHDPREAADAWRRVLRMRPADPEAQAGLERAKAEMLHRRAADDVVDASDESAAGAIDDSPAPLEPPSATDRSPPLQADALAPERDEPGTSSATSGDGDGDETTRHAPAEELAELAESPDDRLASPPPKEEAHSLAADDAEEVLSVDDAELATVDDDVVATADDDMVATVDDDVVELDEGPTSESNGRLGITNGAEDDVPSEPGSRPSDPDDDGELIPDEPQPHGKA